MGATKQEPFPLYIVSGGAGASGEQLVYTVLVQFPDSQVPVITEAHVRHLKQIDDVVSKAAITGGTIVHTMVDSYLRNALNRKTQEQKIVAIDLMGELITHLSALLGQEPLGRPGLYRQLHQDYFERVEAIEFTMAHDDGKSPQDWPLADIVVVGASRVGKTPLSMYLAVLGWKVANVPLVADIPPPAELFELDQRRIVGLTIEPGQLLSHRQERQKRLGTRGPSDYTDPAKIYEEVEAIHKVIKRGGFAVINVTDKPIETSADEIIRRITRQTKGKHRQSI